MPNLTIRWPTRLVFAGALCLLLFSWAALAGEEDTASDQNAEELSLESEVMLPPALWPDAAPLVRDESAADADPEAPAVDGPPAQPEPVPSTALALPPPLDPPPLTEVSVMLDWYLSPQHAALLVAQARELFKEQGLGVELLSPADPTIALKLLVAEEVDLALTRQPILHLQAHKGEPLTRVGTLIETPLNAVIVTGSAAETDDVALLAGRDYGFSTREGETIVAERLIPQSLRQTDGFKAPVNVHFDATAAVVRGDANVIADGYFDSLPEQLAPEGIESHVIRYEEIDIPRHDGVIIVANSQTLGRRGATWARFMSAVEQASHWMIENPEASWALIAEQHPILDNAINEANWASLLRRLSLSPAAVNTRRYQAFETYLLKRGLIDETLPVSRLAVDPHTLAE